MVSSKAVISCDDHLEKQTQAYSGSPDVLRLHWDLKAAYISGPVRSFKPATNPYGVTYRVIRPHVWKAL